MGSLGEEELVQMVRDFIESESLSPFSLSSSPFNSVNHDNQTVALQEILWRVDTADEVDVLEKVLMYASSSGTAGDSATSVKKWVVRRLKMDGFDASLCKTSWKTATGGFLFAGGYEYIEVMLKAIDGGKATRLIVDIDFRSQFELARPTPTYTELIKTLPSIFVGNEENLNKIISLLCKAAKQSLKERGLHIPPWRTANYMQAKWVPENCIKVPIFSIPPPNTKDGSLNKWEPKTPHCSSKFNEWVPPVVKPRTRRGMNGAGSALSSQFSNLGINCC